MPGLPHLLADLRDGVLSSYARLLFSRSRAVGLVLLGATLVSPRAAAYGLMATILAFVVTRVFRLSEDLTRTGLFGYNALLIGVGGAAMFGATIDAYALLVVGVVAVVFMTAALYSLLGLGFDLPALTLPFLAVFYLVLGAARVLDVPLLPLLPSEGLFEIPIPDPAALYLRSLGAIFFLPRLDAGVVVLLALLVHSRIAGLLSVFGFLIAFVVAGRLLLVLDGSLPMVLGYNFILTAIALGGIWFVPSPASMLLAVGGTLVCGIAAVGLVPYLTLAALPLLILPFNLTVILVLYAMRQRLADGSPKAVDFAIGTPEENLNYYRTRIARFGAHYQVRFAAPFLGRWTCTQGVQGQYTHRGPWRHAFDFEVLGADGKAFAAPGTRAEDYLCFRLPVLAAADGTVVRVVDDVLDNAVGEQNLRENWGNLVLLYHAPRLYSLVCHLARGSTCVQQGQIVRRGEPLGACGNSGRSPVPHLHFQLQATPVVGAPTLHGELHDVVLERDGQLQVHATMVPQQGDLVRNIDPIDSTLTPPSIESGPLIFEHRSDGSPPRRETIVPEIDLLGARLFRSQAFDAVAYYQHDDALFRIIEVRGPAASLVHVFRAALASVPLEVQDSLRWTDHLERRVFLTWPARGLLDLVSPFWPASSAVRIHYHLERAGEKVQVVGVSERTRGGQPWIGTCATFDGAQGLVSASVRVGKKTHQIDRVRPGLSEGEAQ